MGFRERLGGEWWTPNMEVHGECVLVSLLGHMGWVYGRILRGVERSFVGTPGLRWKTAPR